MVEAISFPLQMNTSRKQYHFTPTDSIMRYAKVLGYGDIHVKMDKKTGLHAIIAVHNLNRGPAIGGCRFTHYQSSDKALEDVLRLGYMMSYKAAINNLPHGGAKSVIIKPKVITNKEAFFEKFGEFVHELGGNYITAVDSGTSPIEMDIIARKTPYVTCTSTKGGDSDPSPLTALGVRRAIQAAVHFKLGKDTLNNIHIAIQGAGHVGYHLTKELIELGAKVTVADINPVAVKRCTEELGAQSVHPDQIHRVAADVYAPCAMGATLNLQTINELQVKIVAGSANNQLAHHLHGKLLHERGILYAPDFLINAGGLIHVAVIYNHGDMNEAIRQIENIYDTVYHIFERSAHDDLPTNKVAESIARERLENKSS